MGNVQGTIKEYTLNSRELNDQMITLVYTPATFSPFLDYSVLIVQDVKDYIQMGKLTRFADELIENNEIKNIIIVGTHYKSIEDRRNKYHPQGKENEAFIRFLAHELVPWIDNEFPTTALGKDRYIMGDSLAGTVAFMTAVKYPNIFGNVIMHSPYVDNHVLTAAKQHPNPSLLSIYHVVGKDEKVVKISNNRDFLTPNRKLNAILVEKGFQLFYDEFDGGHSWKYWQPDVKRALQKMFI